MKTLITSTFNKSFHTSESHVKKKNPAVQQLWFIIDELIEEKTLCLLGLKICSLFSLLRTEIKQMCADMEEKFKQQL